MMNKVGIERDFSITGGIAKNKGMVAKIREKVGLDPLLAEDPQLIGALGAALFAKEKFLGQECSVQAKVQYGYSDGTGDYYISIDLQKCNGCSACVNSCPASIFELEHRNGSQPSARVKDSVRKKLAIVCPGFHSCPVNCVNICQNKAILLSW